MWTFIYKAINPFFSFFLFSSTLISIHVLQLNEDKLGTTVMIVPVFILLKRKLDIQQNYIRQLVDDITLKTQVRHSLLQFLQTRNLLKDQDLLESDWLRDVLQKLWLSYLINAIQEELKGKATTKEFITSEGAIIRFERFLLKKEIAPVFKDITPEESLRTDSIILKTRIIFLGSIWLLDTRKDSKVVLKDIPFRGLARVVFRPLMDASPFLSGFAFHFITAPIIDSSLNLKALLESSVRLEDTQRLHEFILNECTFGFVYPNQIFITLLNDTSVTRNVRFTDSLLLCAVHIIEAENLKLDEISKVCNPFCSLNIGQNFFKTVIKQKTSYPRFDDIKFVVINDTFEYCSIQIFNRIMTNTINDIFVGQISFPITARLFNFSTDDNCNQIMNGSDVWLPLEKCSQGSIHFRFAVFILSEDLNQLYNTVNKIQALTDSTWRKIPISVVSIFVTDLQLTAVEHKEISNKSKDKKVVKLEISFNGNKYETNEAILTKEKYIWNTGFNLLNFDIEHERCINANIVEISKNKRRVIAKASLTVKDVFDELHTKQFKDVIHRKMLFKKLSAGRSIEFGEFGKADVFIRIKAVKLETNTLLNLTDSFRRQDIEQSVVPHLAVPISILTTTVDEKPKVSDNKEMPKTDPSTERTENECAVKMQLSFISKSMFCVHIISAKNLPVFDDGENPNPAIIVELWRNNVKIAQKSTKFCRRTRDPHYGRKLLFQVSADASAKFILRVLVASKIGFFHKKIVLIAEMFKQMHAFDGFSEKDWYKLNIIRVHSNNK